MELLDKPIAEDITSKRLAVLAARYRSAGNPVIQLLNLAGGQADGLMAAVPEGLRNNLEAGTERALAMSMSVADKSRGVIGEQPGWLTTVVSTAMGAAGGFGGMTSSLAELPITTTIFLHGIQSVAKEHGFDPSERGIQFDCIQVFAASGPLDHDDGADLAFFSSRVFVAGASMQALIARVAPKLAAVFGQKIAAQAVPILGAAAGAATNYAYAGYYREIAHIHFGLRRLAIDSGRDLDDLVADLRLQLER